MKECDTDIAKLTSQRNSDQLHFSFLYLMNYNITNLRKRLCTGLPIWVGVGKGENRAAPPFFSHLFSPFLLIFSRQPVKMVTKNLERGKEGRGGGGEGGGTQQSVILGSSAPRSYPLLF